MYVQYVYRMKLSKKNIMIFSAIGIVMAFSLTVFSFSVHATNNEPEMIIGSAVDDVTPAGITIQEPYSR